MILLKLRDFAIKSHLGLILTFSILVFSCTKDKAVTQAVQETQKKFSNEDLFRGIIFMSGSAAEEIPEIRDQVSMIKALNPTDENQAALKNIQDKVIQEIEVLNPGYLNTFGASILSHDQERIKEEIAKANDIVFVSLAKYFDVKINSANSAKEEVLTIFQKQQSSISGLLTKYQLGEISKQELEDRMMTVLNLDKTHLKEISTTMGNKPTTAFAGCVAFLSFVGCNVAVAINIAGYINVALAAAVAIAAALAIAIKVTVTVDTPANAANNSNLNYDNFINSIATKF